MNTLISTFTARNPSVLIAVLFVYCTPFPFSLILNWRDDCIQQGCGNCITANCNLHRILQRRDTRQFPGFFFFRVGEDEHKLTSRPRSAQKHSLSSEGYWKMMGSLSQSQTLKSGDERDGQNVYLLGISTQHSLLSTYGLESELEAVAVCQAVSSSG